jgi:hypothetical protein
MERRSTRIRTTGRGDGMQQNKGQEREKKDIKNKGGEEGRGKG